MAAAWTATAPAPAGVLEAARRKPVVDLTQVWHNRVPTWPYFPSSMVRNFQRRHRDGVLSLIIETTMHSGTHIDVPLHLNAGGWDLCHCWMMARDLMHADNIGGDIAKAAGKRIEVQAFPWRLRGGEACIARLPADVDE